MKKIILFMGVCALMLSMNACKSNSNNVESEINKSESIARVDNSQNSLDWPGSYQGILPCADCIGIETVITLNSDDTYKVITSYSGKGEGEVFEEIGTFTWTADGGAVLLKNVEGEKFRTLKVGENKLLWLDDNGKVITGDLADKYILNKVDSELVEKYWKLIELFGKPLEEGDVTKDAYITLRALGNRVNGNLGCNTFFGTYEQKGKNQIRFSKIGSTMMMCLNMDVENKMKDVLAQADNYYAKNDTLILNKARMAPLARFVAVYM